MKAFLALLITLVLVGGAITAAFLFVPSSYEDQAVREAVLRGDVGELGIFPGAPKPVRVDFIQWGPNRTVNKVKRIVRVVYRRDGELHDDLFGVVDGKVQYKTMNPHGDSWGQVYDKQNGK